MHSQIIHLIAYQDKGVMTHPLVSTDMPAYSDTLGERQKCHCKRGVTVTMITLDRFQSSNCEYFNTLMLDKKVVIVGVSIHLICFIRDTL